MCHEIHRRGLQGQILPCGTAVKKMDRVWLGVPRKNLMSEHHDQYRGTVAPHFISLGEQLKEIIPMRRIAPGVEKAPLLFVISGRSPAGCFKKREHFVLAERL